MVGESLNGTLCFQYYRLLSPESAVALDAAADLLRIFRTLFLY